MNGRCYKPLVAVAMIRDVDEPEQSQSQPILFLRLHGGRAGSHGGRKGLIDSACSPQMVQKNRQFAGHDHAPNPEFLPPLLGLQDMPANHCENCLSQIPDPGAIFLTCVVESKII